MQLEQRTRARVLAESGLLGLALGLVVVAPWMGSGYLLLLDWVSGPEQALTPGVYGLSGSALDAMPFRLATQALRGLVGPAVTAWLLILAFFPLAAAGAAAAAGGGRWRAWPAARAATENIESFFAVQHDGWMIARTGYTGEDGFEITLPAGDANQLWNALLECDVVPAGLGARDTLRLEAGMNLYGQDMDEGVTPLESGLGWTVDLKSPRDFIGKKALVESRPGRKLVGLVLRERGVLRAHQKVIATQGDGEITSGTFSPTLGISIALARVPVAVELGSDVSVEVRGRQLRARAVKYPFVRNGQSLVDGELTKANPA